MTNTNINTAGILKYAVETLLYRIWYGYLFSEEADILSR